MTIIVTKNCFKIRVRDVAKFVHPYYYTRTHSAVSVYKGF